MKTAKLAPLLLAATAVFLNGCATSKLWEADHFAKFGEPAPDAKLQLFHSDRKRDVLVEYDELQSGKNRIRRRADFLQPMMTGGRRRVHFWLRHFRTACGLLRTLAAMIAPCSVKA